MNDEQRAYQLRLHWTLYCYVWRAYQLRLHWTLYCYVWRAIGWRHAHDNARK